MKRGLIAAVLVFSLGGVLLPSSSFAQFLNPHLEAKRYDNLRRHQQRLAKKRQAERANQGLSPHQKACAKRYPTYNPQTDRYVVRPGVTARCQL
jgi:hypothetical protein